MEFCEKVLSKYHPGKRMANFDSRWGMACSWWVKSRSGDLIVVDGESKEVKYVRTVKRIPEEQRWDPNNLEWITMVPWNRGSSDKEADGDLLEFDVKKGPGRQLTEEEKQDIMRVEAPRIIHRAHFRKADFDKHDYTDRCPGCSAILRGLHVQPHSAECRNRMEIAPSSDIWVENAKARMKERSAKMKSSPNEVPDTATRRTLEDIEDQVMKQENPTKMAELFDRYRAEYLNDRNDTDGESKKRMTDERSLLREQASGSDQPAAYEEVGVEKITEGNVDPWEFLEAVGCDKDDPTECLKTWESREDEEFALDDVNNIALLLELVTKGSPGRNAAHERENLQGGQKRRRLATDKTHGAQTPMVRLRWVARDFNYLKEKDREDLFSATPSIELMRFVLSRQATMRKDEQVRKTMFLDIKKAHLAPLCKIVVYVELPPETEVQEDECGKLIHW